MPFKSAQQRNVGTAAVKIGAYSPVAPANATVIGLSLCNTSNQQIAVDVYMSDGTNNTYLVKGAPVFVGGTLVAIGGDQKVVLTAGFGLFVVSSVASSVDAIMGFLENAS